MDDKARLTVPYLDGVVTEYLDTGAGMVAQGTLVRALADIDATHQVPSSDAVTYPNAHTARIRITLPEARAADRVILEGITQLTGLTYTLSRGDGTSMTEIVSSTAITAPHGDSVANILIRIATPVAATTYDIEVTGFTEAMQIEGLMLGAESFEADYNYSWGATYADMPELEQVKTKGGSSARLRTSVRSRNLRLEGMSEANVEALRTFIKNKLVRGYCLFEQDQTTNQHWFLGSVSSTSITPTRYQQYSVQLTLMENNQCP